MTKPVPTESPQGPRTGPTWRAFSWAALGLLVVVLLAHGASLWDGVFFDDHWHRATLRNYGWGFSDLIESATFDLPGELTHLWWQEQPLQWRYARAAAMLMMKIELVISRGSPLGVHACSLAWHWGTALLLYSLAAWAFRQPWWAFLAGVVFVINPHSVFAVSWIAARNALVGGFFFVAALRAYAWASFDGHTPRPKWWSARLLIALLLWAWALLSRETGVIFPVVALALDGAFGGWRHIWRRWPVYILLGLLTIAYLYWRLIIFPTAGVPDIYFTAPSGLAYIPWATARLLHLLFAQVFYTPMFLGLSTYGGSTGGHVATYVVMSAIVGLIAWWYIWAARGQRGRWLWPAWCVLAFVPVIPVFVMPHFSYLPAAAYAIMVSVMLAARLHGRARIVITVLVLAGMAWSHFVYRVIWRSVLRSEQLIYADIVDNAAPPPPHSKLFFIDLPVAGIYAPVALREAWHENDLQGYVLTFAPQALMMDRRSQVVQLNDHELRISLAAPGYFSGLAGRMLVDGMRPGHPLTTGTIVPGPEFETTVEAADATGVTQLRFTFHQPLTSPDYAFFISTPDRPAALLHLSDAPTGHNACRPADDIAPNWTTARATWLAERDWYFWIVDFASRFLQADVVLTGPETESPPTPSTQPPSAPPH